ncbi:FecR domain-containing protein [Allopusillimonas ginsengisoli]|uniref:FecR domain-containing protein n=1 Tax=Allopusillimonas ginsengisoli TaxID=453575 RepID=UPI001ADC682A|nr:FecR domain-containing protein [Allopusillimonas ginsengisoli]
MRSAPTISPGVLEQAAEWLVRLNSSTVSDQDHLACERWRRAAPEHALAWARAELLMNKLDSVPPRLAMPALDRPHCADRRAAMLKLASVLALLPTGWLGLQFADDKGWMADYHTGTGVRRSVQLADGSSIQLNTATSIDVQFSPTERTVLLRHGEILVQTAPDTAAANRPFRVRTAQGLIEALGTRFSVRQHEALTEVAVFEHAVRIEPSQGSTSAYLTLDTGHTVSFTNKRANNVTSLAIGSGAWIHGMLMVDRMRLRDFIAELARYRGGLVRCDPAVADIRISGTFPMDDTDMALAMLAATYPVTVRRRLRGYWVTLEQG